MEKKILLFLACILIFGLTGCKNEKTEKNNIEQSSEISMKKVEDTEKVSEKEQESSGVKEVSESKIKEKLDIEKLLFLFGDGYANYDSINDRNNKLKKLMTTKCVESNGLNFDSSVKLSSRGEVTAVYQSLSKKNNYNYGILLKCEQNGSEVKILLLVKLTDNKVSEMTYNTVKQEY